MFKRIAGELAKGRRMAVATVLLRSGSGPREPGAMMAVAEDESACGTVGGGMLEAKTLEAAKAALQDGKSRLLSFDLNAPGLSDGVMVCGGRVDILVDGLDGNNPGHVRIFQKLADALESQTGVYLITSMAEAAGRGIHAGHGLLIDNDFDDADLCDPFRDASQLKRSVRADHPVLLREGASSLWIQPIHPPGRVFMVGAGHVGRALAAVCAIAGFQTFVIDDRPEFVCRERFPDAAFIKRIDRYADALKGYRIGASDAVVIATHSHRADRDVLAAALATQAGYIGMIASRRKRDMIYSSLAEEGVAPESLARVHSPAGLDLGARTPAEIAVSIVAQLICLGHQGG